MSDLIIWICVWRNQVIIRPWEIDQENAFIHACDSLSLALPMKRNFISPFTPKWDILHVVSYRFWGGDHYLGYIVVEVGRLVRYSLTNRTQSYSHLAPSAPRGAAFGSLKRPTRLSLEFISVLGSDVCCTVVLLSISNTPVARLIRTYFQPGYRAIVIGAIEPKRLFRAVLYLVRAMKVMSQSCQWCGWLRKASEIVCKEGVSNIRLHDWYNNTIYVEFYLPG